MQVISYFNCWNTYKTLIS